MTRALLAVTMALSSCAAWRVPPMGWSSWALFRCDIDCARHPDSCISEQLIGAQAAALVAGGFAAAGYRTVELSDCWQALERDAATGQLLPDAARFPSGMHALG